MRKTIIVGILVLGTLLAATVYAHFAESYTYFIEGVEDEGATTARLEKEIAETNREIEQINPQLATLEQEYGSEKDEAVSKLQFYNTIGLDALTGFILQSESITDVLANRRIVEKQLKDDLSRLNDLYQYYEQTKAAKETLAGHEKLLGIIRRNLEEREAFDAVAKKIVSKG
jgi:ABC-type transporter Mla subunit MlaD